MMTSSPELPHCDTELSLGRPRATRELKQKQKQAAATATPCCGGGGRTATEFQATAILRVARLAVAEERPSGDNAAARPSMRRSMEWFLQRRREARRQRDAAAADSAAASPPPSPSSSSFSCLTDSSRI